MASEIAASCHRWQAVFLIARWGAQYVQNNLGFCHEKRTYMRVWDTSQKSGKS
jgi:hypothetical protein